MTFDQLESFLTVADCGSFSKAAKRAFVSPSALIQQMNLLEQNLGFKLLARSSKGVELTRAGQEFYDGIRDVLARYDDLRHAAYRIAAEENGHAGEHIRVGASSDEVLPLFPLVCKGYRSRYPHVDCQVVATPNVGHPREVMNGDFDVCIFPFSKDFEAMGLEFHELYIDRLTFLVPPGHRLSQGGQVSLEDFCGEVIVVPECYTETYQGYCAERALAPSEQPAIEAVEAFDLGSGTSLALEGKAALFNMQDNLSLFPLVCVDLQPEMLWPIGLITRSNPTDTVRHFVEYVQSGIDGFLSTIRDS